MRQPQLQKQEGVRQHPLPNSDTEAGRLALPGMRQLQLVLQVSLQFEGLPSTEGVRRSGGGEASVASRSPPVLSRLHGVPVFRRSGIRTPPPPSPPLPPPKTTQIMHYAYFAASAPVFDCTRTPTGVFPRRQTPPPLNTQHCAGFYTPGLRCSPSALCVPSDAPGCAPAGRL